MTGRGFANRASAFNYSVTSYNQVKACTLDADNRYFVDNKRIFQTYGTPAKAQPEPPKAETPKAQPEAQPATQSPSKPKRPASAVTLSQVKGVRPVSAPKIGYTPKLYTKKP